MVTVKAFEQLQGSLFSSQSKMYIFLKRADVCTAAPVSQIFQSISKKRGADGILFFQDESVDEMMLTSASEKKLSVTDSTRSKLYIVSSDVLESEIAVSKCFKLVLVFFSRWNIFQKDFISGDFLKKTPFYFNLWELIRTKHSTTFQNDKVAKLKFRRCNL